jgi:hypothetical protein
MPARLIGYFEGASADDAIKRAIVEREISDPLTQSRLAAQKVREIGLSAYNYRRGPRGGPSLSEVAGARTTTSLMIPAPLCSSSNYPATSDGSTASRPKVREILFVSSDQEHCTHAPP